jgi:hypothetical protein
MGMLFFVDGMITNAIISIAVKITEVYNISDL